jgi:hypothetical protein
MIGVTSPSTQEADMPNTLAISQSTATVSAAVVALVASLVSLVVSAYNQRTIASGQERLQRELADRQADLQRDIESAKDMFERARALNTLTRDRIISRFDGALNAYGVLSTYAQLVGRPAWVAKQGTAAIEDRVQSEASALRSGLEFLRFMKAMPDQDYEQCITTCSRVTRIWGQLIGELPIEYGKEPRGPQPDVGAFLSGRVTERHTELRRLTDDLGTALFESLARITVPL